MSPSAPTPPLPQKKKTAKAESINSFDVDDYVVRLRIPKDCQISLKVQHDPGTLGDYGTTETRLRILVLCNEPLHV